MDAKGEPGDSSVVGGVESGSSIINVRCSNGTKFSVQTTLDATVGAFKALLAEKCDVPVQQQRLIYKGRILKDEKTLKSYGLESDHAVHLVRGAALSNESNAAGKLGDSGIKNLAAVGIDASPIDGRNLDGVGVGAPLFDGLGANGQFPAGASGLFGTGFPEFDQVQQQLTQNPNMMRDILNAPAIQNLMNNPDLIRNLIMSNPQMRDILDRNPDLAHVLNDPSTLRQTLQAARNPELMREMMRNTDRAMSNIESSPEGFNMLRRMYETVQEPFLNATTMAGNTAGDGSNPFAALLGNQGNTTARDGVTNHSATGSDATNSSLPNVNPLPNPWSSAATGATQTTNARSSPAGDERSAGIGGIGGLRIPDLERMQGGLPDILNQMMQNPAMTQMMQSLLSNPQFMNQIFNMNPQLRSMMESNSQLREMLQNPEFLRQFASPETLQQVLSLQQSLLTQTGQQQSNQEQNQANIAAGNAGTEYLMQLFGELGGRSNLDAPSNPDVPPEERYATQLAQLQEMGFFDTQENIRALVATAGNVHAAVERLLGNIGH